MYLILLVSQKGFLSGNTQASSETQNIPDADFQVSQTVRTQRPSICGQPESLGHACARCSVKSGLGEAETTLFSAPRGARVAGWVRGGGSTVHLRVPAAGSGAAGSRSLREPRGEGAPQVASGRSPYLWDGRAGRRGGRRASDFTGGEAAGGASRVPGLRPGPPRRSRSPARDRPRRRGEGGTRRAGTSGSPPEPPRPLRAAHPFLPAPGWPAAGRETRQETRGRPGPAGRRRGPPPRDPEPGLRASRRVSPHLRSSLFSPAPLFRPPVIIFWGTTRQSLKLAVSLVSQTSLKSFKREELTKAPLRFSPEPEAVIYIKNNVFKTLIRKCTSCVFETIGEDRVPPQQPRLFLNRV